MSKVKKPAHIKPAHITHDEARAPGVLKPALHGKRAFSVVTHFMHHGSLQGFAQNATIAGKLPLLVKEHPGAMSDPTSITA